MTKKTQKYFSFSFSFIILTEIGEPNLAAVMDTTLTAQ